MKLLNVKAVLDRDKGMQLTGHDAEVMKILGYDEVLKDLDDKSTSYAILSHRWVTEVNYEEMIGLAVMEPRTKDRIRGRSGYMKIIKSCEQAMKDGYTWLWIDTCCIDKRSSAELTEAINSMYRWYRDSQMCYVFLNDVDDWAFPAKQDFSRLGWVNGWPEWFSRGWTLQELIAPRKAEFFNKRWESIGTKEDLASVLEEITRIPESVLRDGRVLRSIASSERPCVAQIMSWAADRKTTRVEDRAYSLLGLFGVNMPMLYGEGPKAFQRLQLEIIRASSDHSILAWSPKGRFGMHKSVLADNPSCFRGYHDIQELEPHRFIAELEHGIRWLGLDAATNLSRLMGLQRGADSSQLFRFDVTNLGIQMSLPVCPQQDQDALSTKYFKAMLPFHDHYGNLVTIDLQCRGHSFCRR
ncbi:HET domain-containing protein [Pisolithus orientalis]|uniref:HET domain-containing protein n=1 Tax=Pisolithus orientalis TaxID=936130 RepID=UPI002224E3E9|nr:HET domain-containing protein [Pisolithus orientalis]KAI6002303.1 HET domain-containing protein [Pisolithus orientalis]